MVKLPAPKQSLVKLGTPIEVHNGIYVKRDDLCCESPALAKIRGIYRFVADRQELSTFGILDGRHSRNGWALAAVCREFGKQAVVYWPKLKSETDADKGKTRIAAQALGAYIIPIQASRSAVVYARAREHFYTKYPENNSRLVPNAVKIWETVDETAAEVNRHNWIVRGIRSIVIPCGTGTIASGVLRGLANTGCLPAAYVVPGYKQNRDRLLKYIVGLSKYPVDRVTITDTSAVYGSKTDVVPPFPACEHYEAKAWEWLLENRHRLSTPIAFWNSGD